jgi:3'-5' exoribonuclease
MTRVYVEKLADGDSVEEVFLVNDKQLRANRNGNLYLQMDIGDRTGSMSARMWNAGEPVFRSFDLGDFLLVKGKVQLFQGALQMIVSHIERIDPDKIGLDLADFLPHTSENVAKLEERLRGTLLRLANPHLRALAECFLMDEEFVQAFRRAPAGVRVHHAYVGGLIEHVVTLLDAAERILPVYPQLDRDLLLTGVFLHDVGKVRELTYARTFGYSDEGQLIGHLVIGVEMLNQKAARVPDLTGEPFPPELLLRLKHMVLSHHGSYEFGSPKLPMTPEAIALHYLDNFDAKVHLFTRDIGEARHQASAWTPFNQSLQRRLFKGSPDGLDSRYSPTLDSGE